MNKSTFISSILFVLFAVNCISCSNYLYSISSDTNPANGQTLTIFDPIGQSILFNETIITDFTFKGIISASFDNNEVIILGNYSDSNQSQEVMIQYNTTSKNIEILGAIKSELISNFAEAPQSPLFIGNSYYAIGEINDDSIGTLIEFDFTDLDAESTPVSLPNYYSPTNDPQLPYLAYNELKDSIYVLYQSQNSNSNASLAGFKRSYPSQNLMYSYDIGGLNLSNVVSIFTDPFNNIYAVVVVDDSFYLNVEICKINTNSSQCEPKVYLSGGDGFKNQPFNPVFLSDDGSKVIVVGNSVSTLKSLNIFDLTTFHSNSTFIPNIWNSDSDNQSSYFAYI
ncbi:hypothetical protein ACTA71_003463 [Dictyostelium dimigraforme]